MTYVSGTEVIMVNVKDYVSAYLGWGYNGYWKQIGWSLLFIGVLQCITFYAITYLTFMKR